MTDRAPAAEQPWWRKVLEFPLVAMVIALAVVVGTIAAAGALLTFALTKLVPMEIRQDHQVLLFNVVAVIGLILVYKLVIRHLGRHKRDDLALDGWFKETAAGLGIGFVLMTLAVGVAALFGVYTITGPGDFSFFVAALIGSALFPAVSEELIFRGILFRWIEEFGGSWVALAATSALFGAVHLTNPNASPIAGIAITLEAGIMLGAAYMLTRRLWLAMGIHAAWNFTQGEIWDVPVSGTYVRGLVEAELQGPPLLSGGGFGLEASVIAIVIATAFGVYMLMRAIRKGELVPPMWVKAKATKRLKKA
mgnify:CR=1 FL=1